MSSPFIVRVYSSSLQTQVRRVYARVCVCVCVREIRRTCWKVTRFFLSFCVKTAKNTFQYLTVALVNLVFLLSFLR